jgi:excisionase family DNA binding protein
MQDLIFSQIPIEQLQTTLSDTIKKEFATYLSNLQIPKQQTEYLTRKEAAKLLGVSLPTLNEWTKTGLVQGYRIASRVRYKRDELETSLCKIKTQGRAA